MRRTIVLAILVLCLMGAAQAQLKGPAPGSGKAESRQPQAPSQPAQQQATPDQRGTESAPVVVKVLPTPKSSEETEQDEADRKDISSANWWMVRLTGAIGSIGFVQLIVFGLQARRLKQTIKKMDEIASAQTADTKAMIDETAKTAEAMGRVADGITRNVVTTTTMAQNQREFWQRQMRAYVGVGPGATFEQDSAQPGSHFETQPVIQNDGLTPAYDVVYTARTALLPWPLPQGFNFTLTQVARPSRMTLNPRASSFMINTAEAYYSAADYAAARRPGAGSRIYTYGNVTYRDAAGTERHTKFCFFFIWGSQNKPMPIRTDVHNESD